MNIKVYYSSTTGNTKLVADAIASAAGCRAVSITAGIPADHTDVLFLGGAVYATYNHDIPPLLRKFISELRPEKIGKVYVFCTGFSSQANHEMKNLLERRGVHVAPESFSCKGKLFTVFNFAHPNALDLKNAAAFARHVLGSGIGMGSGV